MPEGRAAKPNRIRVLDGLLRAIQEVEDEWRPTILCISGDVANFGLVDEYRDASEWLQHAMKELRLTANQVVLCPGNHDLDLHHVRDLLAPSNARAADEEFENGPPRERIQAFHNYIQFCENNGIPPTQPITNLSHLTGTRSVNGLTFVVLNSAWYCTGQPKDERNLWLGLPLIEELGMPCVHALSTSQITIGLCHHAPESLHPDEIRVWNNGDRAAPLEHIYRRCHILLSGDKHTSVAPPTLGLGLCWHYVGGPTYESSKANNSFRLIKVTQESCKDKAFQYDPRSSSGRWWLVEESEFRYFPFFQREIIASHQAAKLPSTNLTNNETKWTDQELGSEGRDHKKSSTLNIHTTSDVGLIRINELRTSKVDATVRRPSELGRPSDWTPFTSNEQRNQSSRYVTSSTSNTDLLELGKISQYLAELRKLVEELDLKSAYELARHSSAYLDSVSTTIYTHLARLELNKLIIDSLFEAIRVLKGKEREICIEELKRAEKRLGE